MDKNNVSVLAFIFSLFTHTLYANERKGEKRITRSLINCLKTLNQNKFKKYHLDVKRRIE